MFRTILLAIAVTTGSLTLAAPQNTKALSSGYESYLSRPNILKINPKSHPELGGADWTKLKRAHLEAIAELFEMYPDQEIYFLARDSELLYDLAKWESRGDPKLSSRIHLLNVSRANMRAEHIEDYLAQEGISEEALKGGKKILFVDTGFSGTIPRVIEEYFPTELRSHFQTHLMSSSNPAHPSSRVFLTAINPAAPSTNPGTMHGSIASYEHMPRFTDRSDRFVRSQGKWQPISLVEGAADGSVDKDEAVKYMEDLLYEAEKKDSRNLLSERRAQWRELRELLTTSQDSKPKIIEAFKKLRETHPNDPYIEAMERDFVEMSQTGHLPSNLSPGLSLEDLGLDPIQSEVGLSNKNQLIKKHPQWAPTLEDPENGIKKLIQAKDFGTLGALVDVVQDKEFTKILFTLLGAAPPDQGTRSFIKMLIEKGDQNMLPYFALYTFPQPHAVEMKDLIKLLIEKGDPITLEYLATYTFSKPQAVEMKDLIELLIAKGDQSTLRKLAQYTFARPSAVDMKDLIKLLIQKGDQSTLRWLVQLTFSQPHTAEMKDLIRLIIEKGDQSTLVALAQFTFSQAHAAEMKDLIRLIIEKGDRTVLQDLALYVFSKAQTSEMKDLLESLEIPDRAKRIAFLNERLGPVGSSSIANHSPAPISADLNSGDEIQTQQGRKLFVLKRVDQGKRGVVYQVQDSEGKLFALKVGKDSLPETLKSIAEEPSKAALYKKHGVPHAAILEARPQYVLKEWIEGMRADEWIKDWEAHGKRPQDPQIEKLRALVQSTAESGVYIGDLNPKNLIWNGVEWVVIDSGGVKEGLSTKEAISQYLDKIPKRWSKVGHGASCPQLFEALQELISPTF